MTRDRFGKPVRIAWAAHEIEWLLSAVSLPKQKRRLAFEEIAHMTGRSYSAVVSMSERMTSDLAGSMADLDRIAHLIYARAAKGSDGTARADALILIMEIRKVRTRLGMDALSARAA